MSENSTVRKTILRFLVEDVERNLDRFDKATGRFMTGDGWAVTNQDLVYPLALLYVTESPDNPYHSDSRILHHIERGGDAWRDFQDADGKVEFVKVDGSKWGSIYMPWSMYHWLETYATIERFLSTERKERWREGLTLAYDGIKLELGTVGVHNIPTWNGMALFRAGQVFGREDWLDAGRRMILRTVEAQEPEGYWKEHGGPTPSYNLVYVHALGLYYAFSQDDAVLPSIERATDFHIRYTYPDGSCIETIDGRVKYHDRISAAALSAFSLFPRGRRFANLLVQQMDHRQRNRVAPQASKVKAGGSIKVADAEYGLNPRLASSYLHWTDGPEEEISFELDAYRVGDAGIGVVRREAGWVYCFSECVVPPVSERWGQDRQNFLSIWHLKTGLILGGGNSKNQPEWSSFVAEDGERRHLPTSAHVEPRGSGDQLILGYGGVSCVQTVTVLDEKQVEILLYREGTGTATGQLLFRLKPNRVLTTEGGQNITVGAYEILLSQTLTGSWFDAGPWRVYLPPEAEVRWPVYPFNPYTADGTASLDSAVAVLSVALTADAEHPIRVLLEVNG